MTEATPPEASPHAETAAGMKALPRPSARIPRGSGTPRATHGRGKRRDERSRTRCARPRRNRARLKPRRRARASRSTSNGGGKPGAGAAPGVMLMRRRSA